MTFPFLYELLISIELIRGNSIRRVDGANQRSRARIIFLDRAKEITKSLKFYLDKLNVFKRHHNLKIDLVIFPPFWLYDVTNPGEIVKTNQALLDLLKPFLCNTISGYDQSFEHIFFAEYADNVKSDTFFTYDERHFMNKPKQFLEYNSFCTP